MMKRSNFFKSDLFFKAKAVALGFFPIVLLILPATYFDTGHSICVFTMLTGEACYGCGMTRACMHMIHFDFSAAANYNMLSFIVLPLLCFLYLTEFLKTLQHFAFYNRYFPKNK